MTVFKPSGASIAGVGGISWQVNPTDKEVAQDIFVFLEERRVLTHNPRRSLRDLPQIVRSVLKIREYMTGKLQNPRPGPELAQSIRIMRAASLGFIDKAGTDGADFRDDEVAMTLALGEYHARMGDQLAMLSLQYSINFEEGLSQIIPPEQYWVPPVIRLPLDRALP